MTKKAKRNAINSLKANSYVNRLSIKNKIWLIQN